MHSTDLALLFYHTSLTCLLQGYNQPPSAGEARYQHSAVFWHVWFGRLVFVVLFQTSINLVLQVVRFLVPNVPSAVKRRIR